MYALRWLLLPVLLVWWPVATLMWWLLEASVGGGLTRSTLHIPFEVLKESVQEVAHGRWPE